MLRQKLVSEMRLNDGGQGNVVLILNLSVKTAKKTLIVDTHCLQESQFKFLAVSTQLSCQTISLALKFFLCDVECTKIFKLFFALNDLVVGILVVFDHIINRNLVLCNHYAHLMTFSFTFASISFEFEGNEDGIIAVWVRIQVDLRSWLCVIGTVFEGSRVAAVDGFLLLVHNHITGPAIFMCCFTRVHEMAIGLALVVCALDVLRGIKGLLRFSIVARWNRLINIERVIVALTIGLKWHWAHTVIVTALVALLPHLARKRLHEDWRVALLVTVGSINLSEDIVFRSLQEASHIDLIVEIIADRINQVRQAILRINVLLAVSWIAAYLGSKVMQFLLKSEYLLSLLIFIAVLVLHLLIEAGVGTASSHLLHTISKFHFNLNLFDKCSWNFNIIYKLANWRI